MTPPMATFAAPATISVLPPRLMFELKVKLPDAALNVCDAPSATNTLNVSLLTELLMMPPLSVSVLPVLLPIVNAPAVPSKVRPVRL